MKKDDSVLVMLNEDGVAEVYDDTYDITIHCETEEEQKKVCEILKRCHGWIPVEERLPDTDDYVLMSFDNFSLPLVGRYESDEDGGGAWYLGDCDEDDTCVSNDLFVNAGCGCRGRTGRNNMELTREDLIPTCQNCDYEYFCNQSKSMPCTSWRPDLEYRKMLLEGIAQESGGQLRFA